MSSFVAKVDDKPITQPTSLERALGLSVARCARDGVDALVAGVDGTVYYDLEADSKVDDNDVTYPVIVHTRAILVGLNA